MDNDVRQSRQEIRPLDVTHFLIPASSPLAKAADGQPFGLDPAAFAVEKP